MSQDGGVGDPIPSSHLHNLIHITSQREAVHSEGHRANWLVLIGRGFLVFGACVNICRGLMDKSQQTPLPGLLGDAEGWTCVVLDSS
jgi:hypothetical protein